MNILIGRLREQDGISPPQTRGETTARTAYKAPAPYFGQACKKSEGQKRLETPYLKVRYHAPEKSQRAHE
jgi:hypothetical protein